MASSSTKVNFDLGPSHEGESSDKVPDHRLLFLKFQFVNELGAKIYKDGMERYCAKVEDHRCDMRDIVPVIYSGDRYFDDQGFMYIVVLNPSFVDKWRMTGNKEKVYFEPKEAPPALNKPNLKLQKVNDMTRINTDNILLGLYKYDGEEHATYHQCEEPLLRELTDEKKLYVFTYGEDAKSECVMTDKYDRSYVNVDPKELAGYTYLGGPLPNYYFTPPKPEPFVRHTESMGYPIFPDARPVFPEGVRLHLRSPGGAGNDKGGRTDKQASSPFAGAMGSGLGLEIREGRASVGAVLARTGTAGLRWAEAKPVKQISSKDVAKFVYEDICCKFCMPLELLSDKGLGFQGELVDYLSEKLHVRHRTAIKTGTGLSPFHLVFGTEALLPIDVEIPALKMIALALEHYEQILKTIQAKANAKVKDKDIKKGDMVLRYNSKLDRNFQKKFQIKWQGLFLVLDRFPNGTYQLADLNGTPHKACINGYRLKKYYARLMVVIEDEISFKNSADMVTDHEEKMKTSSSGLCALFTTTTDHE
ncbi:hypothetical protein L7F22_017594 [Adiantum nelumboides]|nr:hypothetical protein [Adiantum nelumboides]